MSLVNQQVAPQYRAAGMQAQKRQIHIDERAVRHGEAVFEATQRPGLFKRIQLPVRKVVAQRQIKSAGEIPSRFGQNPGENPGKPSPWTRAGAGNRRP